MNLKNAYEFKNYNTPDLGGDIINEIFMSALSSTMLTFIGTKWIDKLYRTNTDLTFPEKIAERSKYRLPILFILLTSGIFIAGNFWQIAAIFLLLLMTVTDFEQYVLFDAMTFPFAIIGIIYAMQMNFVDYLIAALIGGGIFLLMAIISRGALGGGDVKLIFALGFWLGTEKLVDCILISTIAGTISALIMILTKKKNRDSYFAYGPYFALSAIYFLLK